MNLRIHSAENSGIDGGSNSFHPLSPGPGGRLENRNGSDRPFSFRKPRLILRYFKCRTTVILSPTM